MQTTQDIIKLLPFKPEFKSELLAKYDELTNDQRFAIERIVWDLYDALYEVRLQENMQRALEQAKDNEEKLDKEFYDRVRAQTEKQLEESFSNTETEVDLSETREKLAKILTSS